MLCTIIDITNDMASMPDMLSDATKFDDIQFEIAVQRYIRNHYSLWHENPLTLKWRTDESTRDIRNGIDYNQDHPDAISAHVYALLKQRATFQPG